MFYSDISDEDDEASWLLYTGNMGDVDGTLETGEVTRGDLGVRTQVTPDPASTPPATAVSTAPPAPVVPSTHSVDASVPFTTIESVFTPSTWDFATQWQLRQGVSSFTPMPPLTHTSPADVQSTLHPGAHFPAREYMSGSGPGLVSASVPSSSVTPGVLPAAGQYAVPPAGSVGGGPASHSMPPPPFNFTPPVPFMGSSWGAGQFGGMPSPFSQGSALPPLQGMWPPLDAWNSFMASWVSVATLSYFCLILTH